jgi:hypothetical protein
MTTAGHEVHLLYIDPDAFKTLCKVRWVMILLYLASVLSLPSEPKLLDLGCFTTMEILEICLDIKDNESILKQNPIKRSFQITLNILMIYGLEIMWNHAEANTISRKCTRNLYGMYRRAYHASSVIMVCETYEMLFCLHPKEGYGSSAPYRYRANDISRPKHPKPLCFTEPPVQLS